MMSVSIRVCSSNDGAAFTGAALHLSPAMSPNLTLSSVVLKDLHLGKYTSWSVCDCRYGQNDFHFQ